ncbi:MAG: G-D-S-L family lipolytic protein [Aequorivita sp.]|nr:G-D-S-L family lipolytic protein [Aequorivita sp.]MBP42372.1 G-D-S-L family lipolytic protein [Aequorivita sp.]|tara:strand:- start:682 stop:1392 length:711 start_codon:yes stop_codon:yes gene_type:complete
MKRALKISIAFNIIFLVIGILIFFAFGGIDYVKLKFNEKTSEGNDGYGFNYNTKRSILEVLPLNKEGIFFVGNSITENCQWNELFENDKISNRGISGDVINGLIDRIDGIILNKPKKIFLMIGINDLRKKRSVEQILTDYERLLTILKKESPDSELFIQSILPTDNGLNRKNDDIIAINTNLVRLADKFGYTYINLFPLFVDESNSLNANLTYDGVHINGSGYLLWKNAIKKYVEQ